VVVRDVAFILVCEQNASIREVVCEYLRLAGHSVRQVSAYDDLLDCSLESAPDAVFIGTDSVDTKAVEIVSHVRRIHAHAPIVFACCHEDEALRITWSDVPNAFLAKPFELRDMVDLVARLVRSGVNQTTNKRRCSQELG
jgi:DNA-binding NtrC family response regulator